MGLLWLTAFIFSWTYLFRLERMTTNLFRYELDRAYLRSDVVAESFVEVARGSWNLFITPFVFLTMTVLLHYYSYWRDSKSIYVMRRLPRRSVVLASCVKGPALLAGIVVLATAALYGLYLGMYWLSVPAACNPRLL